MTTPPSRVARIAVPVPLHRLFDYAVPESVPLPVIGARVAVPFAGRRLVGVVIELNPEDAHDRVRPLTAVLDEESVLGDEVFALAVWLSSYYQHPLGEVLTRYDRRWPTRATNSSRVSCCSRKTPSMALVET